MKLFDRRDRLAAPPPPPVRVNGVEIAPEAIIREIQNHPAASARESRASAARALAIRELLLQEAGRLGLVAEPRADGDARRETDDEALIRQLIEREVGLPEPQEAECRRYYEANRERFRRPAIAEVAHILFAARRDDPPAYAEARRAAEAAIRELTRHPERFADMAAALSACPSAKDGGNLGQISSGQTTPEFEVALSRMEPDSICPEPVDTRYGVHVVRMGRRIPSEVLPFDLVKERIAEYLAERVFRRAVRQYIAILAGRVPIEGVDLDGADGVLVQ